MLVPCRKVPQGTPLGHRGGGVSPGQVAGFHLGQRLVAYDDIKEFTTTNQFHDQEIPILGPEKKTEHGIPMAHGTWDEWYGMFTYVELVVY